MSEKQTPKKQAPEKNTKNGTKRNIIGKNLRELRQARNLKQEDVADALGVPPPTYSSWERGRTQPDVDTILQLARFFDASVERLFRIESRALRISTTRPWLKDKKFHPIKSPFGIYDSIYPLLYNRLYFFDIYEKRLHIELMESWKAEPDKSRYVFRLRSNVRFHHGAPLELEDVKQSYELFLDVFPFFRKFVVSVKIAEEENGIELKLSEWLDLEHLPTPYIIPASYTEDDECFEGTGPYKLTAVEQQKRIQEGLKQPVTLEANNAYFGKFPIIQAVEIHRFSSGAESRDALEAGEVDLAYDLDMVEPGRFEVERGHGTVALYLVLNQSSAICEDKNVREALDYSIDRECVIDSIGISGAELLPGNHLYLILSKAVNVDGENNYDKTRAEDSWKNALDSLKQKGITDPVLKIGASIRDPETKKHGKVTSDIIAEIVRQLDDEFGIKAEEELDTEKADVQVEVIGFKEPHAVHLILHSSLASERPWDYSNVYVDHLLDDIKGMDTYRKIQEILTAERFFLPLFRRGITIAYTKELDTKPKRRVTAPYGPAIAHWEFK